MGFAPQGPSAAAGAAPWDAGAECTRHLTVSPLQIPSQGYPHPATLSVPAGNEVWSISKGRQEEREMTGTVARERGFLVCVAALHPNTNPRQGLLAINVESY